MKLSDDQQTLTHEGVIYKAVKVVFSCNGCDLREQCHLGAHINFMHTCMGSMRADNQPVIWIRDTKMKDEKKIELNAPKRDGLYIVVKRTTGHPGVMASGQPHIHNTKAEAQTEAERLAKEVPQYEFIVMEAISVSKTTKVETTKFKV